MSLRLDPQAAGPLRIRLPPDARPLAPVCVPRPTASHFCF